MVPRVGGEGIVVLKVSQSTSCLALMTLRLRRVEQYSVIIKLRSLTTDRLLIYTKYK